MSTGYQIREQAAMYFVTNTIVDWVDVFTRQRYRDIVIDSLNFCISQKCLEVHGYVIMSNNLHMLLRSSSANLSDTIRDFKRFTARNIIDTIRNAPDESRREWMLHRFGWHGRNNILNTENQFWIHDNRPEEIYSQKFFLQKLNYIHENPVRAGIVARAEEYVYSSAATIILGKQGLIPIKMD
jgi:REP element-mobilizing transposase RayT